MSSNGVVARLSKSMERGLFTQSEFVSKLHGYICNSADAEDELDSLLDHANADIRDAATQVLKWVYARKTQAKEIGKIRQTSPLQPATRICLSGGYTAAYSSPLWLNGKEFLRATFVDFIDRGADRMPSALIRFDDELDFGRIKGHYALLTLLHVANWIETETVTVCIIDHPPQVTSSAIKPSAGVEVESHATYVIESDE